MTVPLAQRSCRGLNTSSAMSPETVQAHLRRLGGWQLADGAIQKRFAFADFDQTMRFVNAVADVARQEDHHPDMAVSYSGCTVRYSTHSANGLSVKDFICAAKLDALA